jgi:Photosynthetic reaction centre cytochrome C subunit
MNHHRCFRICCTALLAASSFATPSTLFAQQPNPPTGPMAPEKYKNIQVLMNVPADQLELTMRYVSAAVDMECVSCHVQDATTGEFAYEKDEKRNKQTARQMMKMVNAINAGGFGINVACATCHAGHNQPVGLPLAEMMTPDEVAQMNAAAARGAAPRGQCHSL